jgi:hypothetical protein
MGVMYYLAVVSFLNMSGCLIHFAETWFLHVVDVWSVLCLQWKTLSMAFRSSWAVSLQVQALECALGRHMEGVADAVTQLVSLSDRKRK